MNSYESPASAIGGARPSGAMLGFVVRMLVYYAVLHALYFLIPISILHDGIYLQVFGRPSAWLIHLMVPAEGVTALTNRIASPRAILEIVRGCDGSGVLFLISAAVVAFPASWRMRAIGVLLGIVLVSAPAHLFYSVTVGRDRRTVLYGAGGTRERRTPCLNTLKGSAISRFLIDQGRNSGHPVINRVCPQFPRLHGGCDARPTVG